VNESGQITDYTYFRSDMLGSVIAEKLSDIEITDDPNGTGNKVVKVVNTTTGATAYPWFWVTKNGDFAAVGQYTLVFDVTSKVNMNIQVRHHLDGSAGGYSTILTTSANQWSTGAKSYEILPYAERDNGIYTIKHGLIAGEVTVPADAVADDYSYYIDNVRIYYLPKGYVTTEALNIPTKADGTSETVYQTPANDVTPAALTFDATTKNYVSVKDTYYIPGYAFLGWYDTDGNKYTPDTLTVSGTHSPKAMYGRWQKLGPGLNIFTGTTEPADFENGSTNNIGFRFNAANVGIRTVVDNSVELGGTGNTTRVLKTRGIWTYHHMFLPGVIEGGRQYEIKYDAYYLAAPLGKLTTFQSWIINTGSTINHTQYGNSAENKAGKWYSGAQTFTPDNSVDYLEIQTKITANSPSSSNTEYTYQYIYFDNMAVTPYYKVTYVDVDGTETVEYALYDAEGKLLTAYTPDASKFASGVTSYKLSADGEVYSIDTPITLANEDVVIYAVADAQTPGTVSGQEMRFDTVSGKVTSSIRFKGYISASNQSKANEYGFIATRKTFLDTLDAELTFDLTYEGNNMFVYGAAYALDENGEEVVNKSIGNDEDGNILFAAVLTGITNDNADQVNEVLVARPYVKYVNGDKEYIFYGAAAENSLVGVAKNVDTSTLPENEKANVEAIVALEAE
ncbi:MAG: hypothetical protein IJZ20_04405, partial [Clostridia bacterium]|nr:hypothetical protein [Clostridia bacterium]